MTNAQIGPKLWFHVGTADHGVFVRAFNREEAYRAATEEWLPHQRAWSSGRVAAGFDAKLEAGEWCGFQAMAVVEGRLERY